MNTKRVNIIVVLCVVMLCAACQPTPEEPVVIEKENNLEEIIEKSQEENDDIEYELDDSWIETFTLNDGELTIVINAQIEASVTNNLPIALSETKSFSVDKINEIINYFCGDAVVYEKISSSLNPSTIYDDVDTVPEIEAAILNLERQKSDPASNLNMIKDEDADSYNTVLSQIEVDIEMLIQRLKTAPESEVRTPIDIASYLLSSDLVGQIDVGNIKPAQLQVRTSINSEAGNTNHVRYSNTGSVSIGNYEDIATSLRYPPQIEHEEALAIAQKAVYALAGEEMTVAFNGVVTCLDRSLDIQINSYLDLPQYYAFIFTRSVNDVSYTYESNIGIHSDRQTNAYSEAQHYEWIEVVVDNEKVIVFDWWTPMEIKEILVEDVQLLSFDKIQEIFKEQIAIQQVWNAGYQDYIEGRKIYIEKITLGMMRVRNPDDIDSYLMIPVWDFFGYYADVVADDYDNSGGWTINENNEILNYTAAESLLTINAYDGSIIDRGLGY